LLPSELFGDFLMKKFAAVSLAVAAALASTSALAFFDSKNKWEEPECWYNPHDCNPYDEWDPRYWMEEFEQMWDDDDDYGYGGPMGFGGPMGGPMGGYGMPYGRPMMPGYGQQMPQQMPYGGAPRMPAPAPQVAPRGPAQGAAPAPRMPYGMPYQQPRMPYGMPYQQRPAPAPAPAAPAPAPQAK
jgi:hypothetical protein